MFLEVFYVYVFFWFKCVYGFKGLWIIMEFKKMMYLRDWFKVKVIRLGDFNDWNDFKRVYNNVNNVIKNVKKFYYMKFFIVCDSNLCKIWKIINEVMGCKFEKSDYKWIWIWG